MAAYLLIYSNADTYSFRITYTIHVFVGRPIKVKKNDQPTIDKVRILIIPSKVLVMHRCARKIY